jgi:hypothetical protein
LVWPKREQALANLNGGFGRRITQSLLGDFLIDGSATARTLAVLFVDQTEATY